MSVKLTNEEAIKIIADYDVNGCGYCHQGGDEIPEAFDMAIAALKDARPKWIPVSEKLPEEETEVLICNAKGDIEKSQGSYSTETSDRYFIWYTSGWHFGEPIAWMPLPKPYCSADMKEEKEC